jgi:hypothetical protein
MSRLSHMTVRPVLATGLVALTLPLAAGAGAPAVAAEGGDFGYSALTIAAPVYVEIYEPTIPIPATPQADMSFGYTKVLADSGSARGRASFLWPGDAVGEGAKTIFENLGLPPEISGPIAEQGYPVQVNSGYPSGPESEADNPIPGTVMRTGATETSTYAQTGYSSTCDTSGGEGNEGSEGEEGGGAPGLPEIPGLPDLPIPLLFDALLGTSSTSDSSSERSATTSRGFSRASAAEETPCQVPAQLSALASFGGFEAYSYTERTADEIVGVSRAVVGETSIAGGLVTLSGVTAKVTSSSDGATPKGKGKASYGTITIAGQEFAIGPEGVEGGGTSTAIPGLPDEPNAALAELGITLTVPEPTFVRDDKEVKSVVEALVVQIDTKTLTDAVRLLPLADILNQLPEDMADLKKALGAAVNLSPRVVMHLGRATSKVETVDKIVIPPVVPDNDPEPEDTATGGTGGGGTGGGTGGSVTPAAPVDSGSPSTTTPEAVGDLPSAELASGLPPLFSIPGLLLFGCLAGAAVAGSYVRRLGAAALGGGGACSHGLDSGLPDLRKAM